MYKRQKQIRPILKANCFQCHGEAEELKGKLDVRLARLIGKGGESGAAIVPGKPEESLLFRRVRDGEMPEGDKKLSKELSGDLGKVAYHAACHLRAQKIAVPGARVLSQIPGTEVRIIERCSAVDGTWGMKAAYYEEGRRYARRLADAIDGEREEAKPLRVVTDCSLAALRIKKENGMEAKHPIELLAEAYGLSGWQA